MHARKLRDAFTAEVSGKRTLTAKATFGEVANLFLTEKAVLRDAGQIRAGADLVTQPGICAQVNVAVEREASVAQPG